MKKPLVVISVFVAVMSTVVPMVASANGNSFQSEAVPPISGCLVGEVQPPGVEVRAPYSVREPRSGYFRYLVYTMIELGVVEGSISFTAPKTTKAADGCSMFAIATKVNVIICKNGSRVAFQAQFEALGETPAASLIVAVEAAVILIRLEAAAP